MASRLLGLLRDWVFLTAFGAGHVMDAYNVAFRLPNLVRDLFAEGAMSAAFVPTFTRELHNKGKDAAWELGRIVITGLIVVTGVITVAGILLAGPLTAYIAPEYAATPGKLELTTTLTQIMFPFLMLIAVAVACMGMLNSLRSFFLPALAPATFNVACIASAFLIVPFMPALGWHAMVGLAIGTLLGGVAQVAMQWPALIKARASGSGRSSRSAIRASARWCRLMIPGTLGLAAAQVNQLVNVYLATSEGEGAVTYLGFAFRLMYLPIGLFGVSIATAAIPGITRHAAADDMQGVRNDVSQAVRMMLMLNVPASFGLIVPGRADHRAADRVPQRHRAEHRRHGRRPHGLRAGPRRLLRREDRLADLLRAQGLADAGDDRHDLHRAERRAQPGAGAHQPELRRPRARHGHRRARQRAAAVLAAAPPAGRARRGRA